MHVAPIATATPDGRIRISRNFRPTREELTLADAIERGYRDATYESVESSDDIRTTAGTASPWTPAPGISLRRAARMEHFELRRENRKLAESARLALGRPGRRR